MKPEQVDAYFAAKAQQPRFNTYDFEDRVVHFVEVGSPANPPVVFVHGSPGTWDAFIEFLGDSQLAAKAHVISVDRLGFGQSQRGQHEPSLTKQAAALMPALAGNRSGKPAILVGHSYGGPVIAQMAVDFPDQVASLIMVAASIDPELEKTKWFQIPANWMVFSWLVPVDLRTSNREILPLKGELEKLLPRWDAIQQPVTVIQGGKDRLVPAGNADFAAAQLVNAPVEMVLDPELNHFIPWTRPDLIKTAVERHLSQLEPTGQGISRTHQ